MSAGGELQSSGFYPGQEVGHIWKHRSGLPIAQESSDTFGASEEHRRHVWRVSEDSELLALS